MSSALVQLNAIEAALTEARTVEELLDIRDKAEAMRGWAKNATRSVEQARLIANGAAEYKIRAERRLGQELDRMPKNVGGRPSENPSHDGSSFGKLEDLGVTHNQSSRWQSMARVPEEVFEDHVEKVKASESGELTSAAVIRLGRQSEGLALRPDVMPPVGKYRTIVIDPPWPMQRIEREERPNQPEALDYPTMSLEEISSLEWCGGSLPAADGCHVYLWVTQKHLPNGLLLFDTWGIRYQCTLTWVKNVGFTPFSWMYSTEHVLFGRFGSLPLLKNGVRLDFTAKVQGHSRKPNEFYDIVRTVSPENRIDMFGREGREGFDVWGNEA